MNNNIYHNELLRFKGRLTEHTIHSIENIGFSLLDIYLAPRVMLNVIIPNTSSPNVCTERKEDIEDDKDTEIEGVEDVAGTGDAEVIRKPSPIFGGLLFSVNSCTEKPHKHVCKQV